MDPPELLPGCISLAVLLVISIFTPASLLPRSNTNHLFHLLLVSLGSASLVLTTFHGQRPKEGWKPATPTGPPKVFSGHSLADEPWPGSKPPVTFLRTEEGPDPTFPKTIPLLQQLLNATEFTQNPAAYSQLVAVMVYTAERAKFSTGVERQDWMQLFIDTFKLVHRDITGDPESVLALC